MNRLDSSIRKWIKWVVILLLARVPKPILLSSFLSLNPFIRKIITANYKQIRDKIGDKIPIIESDKLSNIFTCCFLYFAAADNTKVPKDYLSIYIWMNYIGELNPPSALNILTSRYSHLVKIKNYPKNVRDLYARKEYIFYPLIFGQILSNYLTPTRYKLNQRYLSSSLKSLILNPIWINFSLGVNKHRINWPGMIKVYLKHNAAIWAIIALMSFKNRFLDRYYELKHGIFLNGEAGTNISDIIKNYLIYAGHRANSLVNFIYLPNMLSMLLISLTSPLLVYLRNPAHSAMYKWYLSHMKIFFKNYIKIIGFVAGFVTLYVNSIDIVPDYGYKKEASDDTSESDNIRHISKNLINSSSLYLFRLILLSKWRVVKENHPLFRLLGLRSWNRLEAFLMCVGVFKVMNFNDFLTRKAEGDDKEEYEKLQEKTLPKWVKKIM